MRDGALKLALRGPSIDGLAHTALIKLLAKRLVFSRRTTEMIHGDASRLKRALCSDLSFTELKNRLEDALRC